MCNYRCWHAPTWRISKPPRQAILRFKRVTNVSCHKNLFVAALRREVDAEDRDIRAFFNVTFEKLSDYKSPNQNTSMAVIVYLEPWITSTVSLVVKQNETN